MKDYKFHFIDDVLFLEFNIPIETDTVELAISEVKETFPLRVFKIVAIKNIVGYWSAKDLETHTSIYCGTLSIKTTKNQIQEYLKINKL